MHINLELKFFLQLVCDWKEKKYELYYAHCPIDLSYYSLKKSVFITAASPRPHRGCLSSSTQEIPALENTAQSVNSHFG